MSVEKNGKKPYEKPRFWLWVAFSICMLILAICNYKLNRRLSAEPKFDIAFGQKIPPDQIFSQKANPHVIFSPGPDIYNFANSSKIDGKNDCITIVNTSRNPSPKTFVEIAVENPFSIALVTIYVPGYGWLETSGRAIRTPDAPNHQKVKMEITRIIGKKEELEIFLAIVYEKNKRKDYHGYEKMDKALIVRVYSIMQSKIESPSQKSFSLGF